MEAPPIRFTSLRHAVRKILAGGSSKRTVGVTRVRLEDAPALVSFLSLDASTSRWEVADKRRLKRLAITADLLTIVGSGLLPILVDNPTDKRARDELRRYAVRVRGSARMVGGSFRTEANLLADRMRNYLNQARRLAESRSFLVHLAHDIRSLIDEFKRSDVDLTHVDEQRDEDDDDDDDLDRPHLLRCRQLVAAPTVRVTSFKTALEAALEAGGILVASVHLRHATALQELLRFEDIRHGWSVLNPDRTNAAILTDNTLRLISAGILPSLAENPTDESHLHMLRRCAHELKGYAESMGGCSGTDVRVLAVADLLDRIGDARRQPPVTESSLVASSKELITRIATLRSQLVYIFPQDA